MGQKGEGGGMGVRCPAAAGDLRAWTKNYITHTPSWFCYCSSSDYSFVYFFLLLFFLVGAALHMCTYSKTFLLKV